MSYFKVLYAFKGKEENEMSVNVGDIILHTGNDEAGEWLLVEHTSQPGKKGYVPTSYCQKLKESDLPQRSPPPPPAATANTSAVGSPGNFPSYSQSPISGGITPSHNYQQSPQSRTMDAINTESFNEMFARHEQYFKQVMKQREESFRKLENSIATAAKEISLCQDKNQRLTQRIVELDNLIEDERNKWKDRLETEKKSLLVKGYANTNESVHSVATSS